MLAIEIFINAKNISDPDRRALFVDAQCCGDEQKLREVLELLNRHFSPRLQLEIKTDHQLKTVPIDVASIQVGKLFDGKYEIKEVLSHSARWPVYRASDTVNQRDVAIKTISSQLAPELKIQFRKEALALAKLNSEYIAQCFGFFESADTAYFVMEYVPESLNLVDYCEKHSLEFAPRIKLVCEVCQGLAHAHARIGAHRDIKPSNLLVASNEKVRRAKIIDFGLSNVMDPSVGTLQYLSPEQASGDATQVGPLTDIYQLGTVLFELVTGLPFLELKTFEHLSASESARSIRAYVATLPPQDPLTRLDASKDVSNIASKFKLHTRQLRRKLSGDIRHIVLKATQPDLEKRYQSAGEFEADLNDFLAGRVVKAVPSSLKYRLYHFAKRQKAAIALATVLALLLYLWYRSESFKATAIFAKNKQIAAQYDTIQVFRDGMNDAAENLIRSAADLGPNEYAYIANSTQRWANFAEQMESVSDGQKYSAEGYLFAGMFWNGFGSSQDSIRSFEQSLRIATDALSKSPNDVQLQLLIANSHIGMAKALFLQRQLTKADEHYAAAEKLLMKLASLHASDVKLKEMLGLLYSNHGGSLREAGRHEEAIACLKKAVDVFQECYALESNDPLCAVGLARAQFGRASLWLDLGNIADAKMSFESGITTIATANDNHLNHFDLQRLHAKCLHGLGVTKQLGGDVESALQDYDRAIEIQRALVKQYSAVLEYRSELSTFLESKGTALGKCGKWAIARQYAEETVEILAALSTIFPDTANYRYKLANNRNQLGVALARLGNEERALDEHRKAIADLSKLTTHFPEIAVYKKALSGAYVNSVLLLRHRNKPLACEQIEASIKIGEELVHEHPKVLEYQRDLGASQNLFSLLMESLGKIEIAAESSRAAVCILRKVTTKSPQNAEYQDELARAHHNLANLLSKHLNRHTEAVKEFAESLEIRARLIANPSSVADNRMLMANTLNSMALVLLRVGDVVGAVQQFEESCEQYDALVAQFPDVVVYQFGQARLLNNFGQQLVVKDPDSSQRAYEKALTILNRLASSNPDAIEYRTYIGWTYTNLGNLIRQRQEVKSHPEIAMSHFDASIAALTERVPAGFRDQLRDEVYSQSLASRGALLLEVGRYEDAVRDFKVALTNCTPAATRNYRFALAESFARAGQAIEASNEIETLFRAMPTSSVFPKEDYFRAAYILAAAASKAGNTGVIHADYSIKMLQSAVSAGFNTEEARNTIMTDDDLKVLREREDFKLLMQLVFPQFMYQSE